MKRPLVMVGLCYLGGVLLANWWPPALGGLFTLAWSIGALALLFPSARPWLVWPLICFTGWVNLAARTAVISPHDLRIMVGEQEEYVTLRGTLTDTPTQRVFVRDERESWRTHAVVEVAALRRKDQWEPAFGSVAALTPGVLGRDFFAGQTVVITGVLRPPKGPAAEGLFDYRTYLRWHGIHHQLFVQTTNEWQLLVHSAQPCRPPFADRFFFWAQEILARDLPVEDEPLRLLWAMTLGWQTALTAEVSEPFMRSGTMHIFAISGLHIALIAGILVALLRVLRVPRGAVGVVAIPLIWFYTAATGWQPSAIRSTIMMTVVIAGWALRRPSDLLNSLAASGLIILIWQPEQLFQASFQLSFFVVLSIALLMPPFEQARQRLLRTDPLLPDELRPRWRRWLDPALHFITTSLATSLAAWFGSLPLIAYYFHLFTPGSIIANLLVVPVSSLALACNLGALVCGDWAPWLTALFNHSGWFWMRLMIVLSEWATTLPGAYFYLRPPTPWEFLLYYGLLLLTVSGWLFAPARRRGSAVMVGVLAVAWLGSWALPRAETRVTVLNGANAIFVAAPGRADDVLLDCGSESAAGFIVIPYLRGRGVNHLPQLLLTHGDTRHIGGTALVEKEFKVGHVLTSSVSARSAGYRQIIARLKRAPQRWRQVNEPDELGAWTIVHPRATDHFAQADDNALVLRGGLHGTRLLLLSDLGRAGQRAVLDRGTEVRADIVIAGLPTQAEPMGQALLEAIQPRLIIVQDQEFPASAKVSRKLRERLAQRGVPVLYTTEVGTVTIRIRPDGCEVATMNGRVLSLKNGSVTVLDSGPPSPLIR